MKAVAVAFAVWVGCTFALGLMLRVMWAIFMFGWGLV